MQVSVFNGGTRSGLADETMAKLRARGLHRRATSATRPSDVTAKRVRVFTTEKNDMAARLVARQFGRKTKVVVSDTDLGPGIDVVVGNGFDKLSKARRVIVAQAVVVGLRPAPQRASTDAL